MLTVIFALVVAAVLIGEVYVYTLDNGRYSYEIEVTDDGIGYSVTSAGSVNYSVLVLDNHGFKKIDSYYVYYDGDYGSMVESVPVPVGARAFTQEYYITQLIKMLEIRGICNVEVLNASKLGAALSSDLSDPTAPPVNKGLVVLSGALPDTVYGSGNELMTDWIKAGGSLYWAGNLLGAYYATAGGGIVPVAGDYETQFFGKQCLNKDGPETAFHDVDTNGYRHTLSMRNNGIRYGVDISGMPNAMMIGYTDGTYGSTAMVGLGDGMICVLGGDYSNEQRHDLAQVIASGICYLTTDAGYVNGEIKRNTVNGTIDMSFVIGDNYVVYIYYGGYFPIYGRTVGWEAGP